eukprot:TRINITY_DN3912_c0_g1_i1.p1 TRINITY_DN3912_c0_g1~~TRINITY_DN3912_c0_g1_i1.p1  ORF type:complete len:347 (-),score=35.30 TRINITY_DN3912_c0_g1_i1:98-1138(-)
MITFQNEEVLFIQQKPKGSMIVSTIMFIIMVVEAFGSGIGFIIYYPSIWYIFAAVFFPMTFFLILGLRYYFGYEYSILTNFRVIDVKLTPSIHSATLRSIALPAITDIKEVGNSLRIWCGKIVDGNIPTIEFKNLSLTDFIKVKEIIEQKRHEKVRVRNLLPSMPSTMYGHPNLGSLRPSFKAIADEYAPFLWSYESTTWQYWRTFVIGNGIFFGWFILIMLMVTICTPNEWIWTVSSVAVVVGFWSLVSLSIIGCLGAAGFNALSERHGILIITRGCFVSSKVIPWSKAYPIYSNIDLKDGSGTLCISGSITAMYGPEVVVREEIIYNKYIESTTETVSEHTCKK